MPFEKPYHFKQNNLVVLKHKGDKFLRVDPEDEHEANPNGGMGAYAQWEAEKDGEILRLKSKRTGKYLRVKADESVDIRGGGGKFCDFKPQGGEGKFKLESHIEGRYLAVGKDGEIRTGGGGPWCNFEILRATDAPFTKPYNFANNNLVVIQHKGDKFLRIDPEDEHKADPNGGKGAYAQWEAEKDGEILRLKSKRSGKYLRVKADESVDVRGGGGKFCDFKPQGGEGSFKLESHIEGRFLAVGKDGEIRTGGGGPWCTLQIFRAH